MPPQLPSIRQCLTQSLRQSVPSASDRQLLPLIAPITQTRSASIIASLSDNPGAYNKRIRRGRGPASGKGKTSGRGHKGQKQHGKVPAGFNGGQTPDIVVSGERGFTNNFSVEMSPLNLDRIQEWINQGRLDPSKPITLKELCSSRCLHGIKDGVKLLARNNTSFKTPINIVVSRASAQAIAAVEAAGGTVLTRYYTPFSIQKIRAGLSDPITSLMSAPQSTLLPFRTMSTLSSSSSPSTTDTSSPAEAAESLAAQTQPSSEYPPEPSIETNTEEVIASTPELRSEKAYRFRLPDPISRKDIEYYRDPAHRGYLAWQLKEGEGPSLFFKTPGMKRVVDPSAKKGKAKKKGNAATNRLW